MFTFEEIGEKIRRFRFDEEFDMVVAVANGGIVPAALLNQRLGLEFHLLKISLRDSSQTPMYDLPRLVEEPCFDCAGKRVLLVEDRVKTGASLDYARRLLEEKGAVVRTFAVNGRADYSLLDTDCFRFPWIL